MEVLFMPPSFPWPRASKAGLSGGGGLMMEQRSETIHAASVGPRTPPQRISHRLNLSVFFPRR